MRHVYPQGAWREARADEPRVHHTLEVEHADVGWAREALGVLALGRERGLQARGLGRLVRSTWPPKPGERQATRGLSSGKPQRVTVELMSDGSRRFTAVEP